MEIQITKEENVNVVKIIGRLDTNTATTLEKTVTPLFDQQTEVVFDCTDLAYISSSGLRVILMSYKQITSNGGKLILRNLIPDVRSVMDITGFSRIIPIE